MGRFQQLRAKAISLRGAIAIGGALVIAASMAQASGTLAQSTELREAKAGIATQNYFPTPLPAANMNCGNSGAFGVKATFTWDAPSLPGNYRYRVTVWDGVNVKDGPWVQEGRSRAINWNYEGSGTYQISVQVINWADGVESATSSGELRRALWHDGLNTVNCSGDPWRVGNQPWENQYNWDPDVIPFAMGPTPSIFGALFDEDADLLGDLPEGGELTSLDDVAIDVAPATSEKATSAPRSTPTSSTRSSSTSSKSTSTATSPGATSAGEDAAEPTSSVSATSSSSPVPTTSAAATPSSVKSPPSSSPAPAVSSTTAQQPVRARVGDDPIAVGASQARLERIDGQTQLIVTRNGAQVCTVEVDGASQIESSDDELTITVSGRTKPVDLETCELT